MKKNKGFTLVELLAVIAILAILVIIALPNVMGMFNQAKESSFMTEVKTIYKVAQQTWISDSMFSTGEQTYKRCDGCTGKELALSGRSEIKYYIKIDQAGNVVEFDVTDGTYQFSYHGQGLLTTDITKVDSIANIDPNDVITISDSGTGNSSLGPTINVCIYKQLSSESTLLSRTDKTCYEGQTVEQCVGMASTYYRLYNNEEYGNGVIECFDEHSHICGASDYVNCMNDACRGLYRSFRPTDLVLSSENGCYSPTLIGLTCLDGETLVDVYDRKKKKKLKKKLKDITYDDLILTWNFDKGVYEYEEPLWIMKPSKSNHVIELVFSNNTTLIVVGDHRIFDTKNNTFVPASTLKVGMTTINVDNEEITLVDKKEYAKETYAYNIIVKHHINMYANGILTSQGSNNIYKIENMKFVKEERDKFTEEELSNIDSKYVDGLRLNEWMTDYIASREETLSDMYNYVENLEKNKR